MVQMAQPLELNFPTGKLCFRKRPACLSGTSFQEQSRSATTRCVLRHVTLNPLKLPCRLCKIRQLHHEGNNTILSCQTCNSQQNPSFRSSSLDGRFGKNGCQTAVPPSSTLPSSCPTYADECQRSSLMDVGSFDPSVQYCSLTPKFYCDAECAKRCYIVLSSFPCQSSWLLAGYNGYDCSMAIALRVAWLLSCSV
jgi:hypothetical protein